jgi:hypothetical protein
MTVGQARRTVVLTRMRFRRWQPENAVFHAHAVIQRKRLLLDQSRCRGWLP